MRKFVLALAVAASVFALAPNAQAAATCQTTPVVLFMTSWCPYCKAVIEFFQKENVQYEAIDIEHSTDPRIDSIYNHDHIRGIPYMVIGDQKVLGADFDTLNRLLCIVDDEKK